MNGDEIIRVTVQNGPHGWTTFYCQACLNDLSYAIFPLRRGL